MTPDAAGPLAHQATVRAELIGREAEAAAITAFLEGVPDGPVALVIDGEPGIGKTTIWQEAVRQAEERGYRVLQARPAELEGELSYAGLGDLLHDVLPEVEAALPEPQRDALRAALLLSQGSRPSDPRTTATGLVTVLSMLAAVRPVVVAIDDAQWLDRASGRAVDFAVRRMPAASGVLLARRAGDSDDVATAVRSLGRHATQVNVGPLAPDALRRVLAANGMRLTSSVLRRITDASGGNPFFALELARTIGADATDPGEPLTVPSVLLDLVRDRLDRLSPSAREIAVVAAALPRPDRSTIEALVGSGTNVEAAFLEAEEAGVLDWVGERLRFGHPLLASALYGSLSTGRRRMLHRRLADVASEPEERAHHLVRSTVGSSEDAAREIEAGADVAARRGAVDAAADLYLAAHRLTPAADGDARSLRALAAARLMERAGDLRSARDLAETVISVATDGTVRAQALVLLGSLASYIGTIEERIAAHEAALGEAGDDPTLRAQVLIELGERVTIDPWKAAQQASEAADLLRQAGDTERLARALTYQVMAAAALGLGVSREVVEEVTALEAAAPRRRLNSLIWSHWMDDADATRERFDLQRALARDEGDDVGAAELAEFMAMVEFRAGDWPSAEQRLETACSRLGELGLRGPLSASFADRAVVDAHRGRVERASETMRDLLEQDPPLDRFWIAVCLSALGSVEFATGDLAAADRAWTAMRQAALAVGWLEFPEDRSEPDHVEALLVLGEGDRARQLLGQLEWRGRTLPRPWIAATLPRARALVMASDGRVDDAIALLEAGSADQRFPLERARLLTIKGQLERRANRRLAARRSLEEALRGFEELGSPPWIDRVRAELGRLGLRHRGRHELTAMEQRIAELAATGLTNRQVADAAFVSPKTVEANLARVYGKLGIRSRAELGARMAGRSSATGGET